MVFGIFMRVQSIVKRGLQGASTAISRLTMPLAHSSTLGTIADLARTKPQLVAENLLLRQQLIVLNRSVKRPRFTPAERVLFVLLASKIQSWKEALLIVKPETVLRWHRQGYRLFWKRKSRARSREPQLPVETIMLIKELAADKRLWGAERIRGELLKVGSTVAKRTVQRSMRQARPSRPPGQTWAAFLRNHAKDTWACDVLQVTDIFFRQLFAFVIPELGSRRIVHVGVTRAPTDDWTAQQVREATPFGTGPKYLIRDNDAKYGPHFVAVAEGSGIEMLRTPIQAPRANAMCERRLGSIRRECLKHVFILGEAHLRRVRKEYVAYFNTARPHQGLSQYVPNPENTAGSLLGTTGKVVAFPVLGGLHHVYRRAA